ncbi:MAG: 4'-phosphopantetheinyl transferase superfamily protein [Gemmatimonadetes bacterium]|nr:4'-phosphopantetheinyl transferase superfamily protein [Gemmatimonadota bacterium]MYC70258.1 4'-phosphopantetheinyl transferase superfamily protein [Gemmatimonadota bacterium]MYI62081.1 4'-phosphopantetheinyl transferase superfamily protein [Gemmatimonadota bacterium]
MTIAWETPSSWPRLSDDEIHVWCVELDAADEVAALAACLNEEERERARGLLSGTHQRRFVVARGMLRRLLGLYLDQDPSAVTFARGAHGKPFLPEGGLHFNVSHTHELALYAIARDHEVGVDVEWMRPQVAHEQIAARFFSLEEQEALAQVPDEERQAAFYNIWTRKEAYIKARGDGIAAGLGTFAVSLGSEAALLHSDEGRDEVERWKLIALEPAAGYVAALCGAGVDWRLRSWRWRP